MPRKRNKWSRIKWFNSSKNDGDAHPLLWMRKLDCTTEEEFASFYRWPLTDMEDHLSVRHSKVEGLFDFRAMLFVTRRVPDDVFEIQKRNTKLYVRRAFKMYTFLTS